ncbi:MAG TPA: sulfatase [Acidobacteriaceae bacterium]|nr:sulfatase [Acidobacteriaceae bacterium]
MSSGNGVITRREAIKRISGATLGAGLSPAARAAQSEARPSSGPSRQSNSSKQPNVLWITGEGVPQHALSCYGSRLIHTPNIDRIANEGMRFENSFTTNALCSPARATLLTGKYNHLNGMIANPGESAEIVPHFEASQETLPKILKRHGYQTGTVGKWHLPANPGEVGFDYFVYKEGAGGPYYDPNGYLQNPSLGSTVIEKRSYPGYETDNVTDLVIQGIQQFDKPFFMMVQYFNAHRPFDPPHQYEHLYDAIRIPEPATFWDDYSMRASPAKEARMRIADMMDFHPPQDLTDRQRQQWNYHQFMAHFLGTLRAQDDNIGRLFDFLDKAGLAENTIIIYTTDHGFFLGDHGWFDKRFMYEQALKVPWMIRHPGRIKAGSVTTEWTANIDNAPTVLDLLGIPIPEEMQGKSLVPVFQGQTPPDRPRSMYYHYYGFGAPHWVLPHYGIRTDRYKLISYYTINEWELFDLEKDPDEMENLFVWGGYKVHPAYEAVAHDLAAELKSLRAEYKDTTGPPVQLLPVSSYN